MHVQLSLLLFTLMPLHCAPSTMHSCRKSAACNVHASLAICLDEPHIGHQLQSIDGIRRALNTVNLSFARKVDGI
jgi:hypothetical protein